jgi:signal transduction histidine kinase
MSTPISLRDAIRATTQPEAYFSLLTKGLLLIAGPVVLLLLLVAMLVTAQRAATQMSAQAAHGKDVLQQAAVVQQQVLEAVARMRGAAVAGAVLPGEAAAADAPGVVASVDTLRRMVADNLSQVRRADAIRVEAVAFEEWIRSQHALIESGKPAEAAANVTSGLGAERLAAVRTGLEALLVEEARLERAREQTLNAAREAERRFLIASLVTGAIATAIVAWLFARGIAARLAAVNRNADRLSRGVPLEAPVAGWDEIAALDSALFDAGSRLADVAEAEARHKQELEARAADLARVNHELSQTMRDNEMFVYSVSHDLRSPLVNLQGFSKELARGCDDLRAAVTAPGVPPAVHAQTTAILDRDFSESIRFIRKAVERSAGIIDSLLQLARAGRVEYRQQDVDLSQVVSTVLDAMRTTITERGARLRVGVLDTVHGDPTAIEQIVANLIHNAVSYLDPGRPGLVEVEMVDRVPPAAAGPAHEAWEGGPFRLFAVRDNGTGIPAQHLPKIFVAFQRLDPAKAAGEGIGLALVRRMVDRHRGGIWVESTVGVGSSFYVALPAPGPRAASAAGRVPAEAVSPEGSW